MPDGCAPITARARLAAHEISSLATPCGSEADGQPAHLGLAADRSRSRAEIRLRGSGTRGRPGADFDMGARDSNGKADNAVEACPRPCLGATGRTVLVLARLPCYEFRIRSPIPRRSLNENYRLRRVPPWPPAAVRGGDDQRACPGTEKCYGVAKAGQNDCKAGAHDCKGQSEVDADPDSFVFCRSAPARRSTVQPQPQS